MAYQSGDDPQLLRDLRTALKRWHRPTLGDAALAGELEDVQRRLAADPRLTRSNALRQTVRAALASLRDGGRSEEADLLEGRYLRDESVIRLTETYHLSERTLYQRLQEAHLALAHAMWVLDPAGAGAAPDALPATEPSRTLSRARHLPPQTGRQFFGVDEVLAQLLYYLEDRDAHWVISLDGMAGLGKTALAREAAGRLAETDRFTRIAWVTVRPVAYTSHGPQQLDLPGLSCGQVLDTMASQLGCLDVGHLSLPAKRERTLELLRSGSCLVVLDNLETAMDCGTWPDWFWDMANPSKFLLTSRQWLRAGVGPSVLSLDQLVEAESLALIRHEADLRGLREVAGSSDETLREILAVTGGNPLAIKLVVGQLVSLPLSRILAALETAQPGAGSPYDYLYRASWDLLSAPARRLLLCMARLPSGDGVWEDLSAVSGLSGEDLNASIEELASHSLVQAVGFEKTYSLHPLTHHFAASQAGRDSES